MLKLGPDRFSAEEFASQTIAICGKHFVADRTGALYWPAERALIVADLHLEKGTSYAGSGQLLPPYDTRETLMKLATVIDRYQPETLIALGDSFHDLGSDERMAREDRETLAMLQEASEWIWVTGNHDPEIPKRLGGYVTDAVTVEGMTLRHAPTPGRVTHEIAGHLHPAARISLHGYVLRRACFVGNGLRLVIPAFGAYTGGLNVLEKAFEPMFGADGLRVWMLGQEGLYPIATRLLRED